jgi:hypothetical protein
VERNALQAGQVQQAEAWPSCSLACRQEKLEKAAELLDDGPVDLRNWRATVNRGDRVQHAPGHECGGIMDGYQCKLCDGNMEPGFVLDHAYGQTLQEEWVEGEPQQSFWTGLKLKGATRYKVTTYRCAACGHLESFAVEATQ